MLCYLLPSCRNKPRVREYSRSAVKISSASNAGVQGTPGVLGPLPTNDKPQGEQPQKPKWDDKMSALRVARKVKGLCMSCGEI
jgi:hypothetical protein